MFGESESESPRVPSPWDSLISSPPSPIPGQARAHTPSPLAVELIPKLVPEADDGNVEYKLQLLNPSPARFARLVTQMKWRLLEGGGQAYYELGVADSGDLIGLPREELEQSLETLEMMAGEIGASVIVVKEIEVSAAMAGLAKRSGEWAGAASRRSRRQNDSLSQEGGYSTTSAGTTETETDPDSLSGTDVELSGEEAEDLSTTVVFQKSTAEESIPVFSIDLESEFDPADAADDERLSVPSQTRYSIDLEIASVFKPRPMRTRIHDHSHLAHTNGGKNKRVKKHKHLSMLEFSKTTNGDDHQQGESHSHSKTQNRRHGRDRRREEKRKTLESHATQAVEAKPADTSRQETLKPSATDTDALISGLEQLHVAHVEEPIIIEGTDVFTLDVESVDDFDDDDDVFASPTTALPSFPTFSASSTGESHLDAAVIGIVGALKEMSGEREPPRLIVEALVVRKMSLEEAFLDFGGFSLI
ncbi:hypothetical protein B0H34DRAFT_783861 [Crassisporium funariophilum]|nr:hypothetical protein B0H34DRAFT_783861 [Crassisporium funariophilum]